MWHPFPIEALFIFQFIYVLYNDAVTGSGYIASDDRIIGE
jgi:hypothetical protein